MITTKKRVVWRLGGADDSLSSDVLPGLPVRSVARGGLGATVSVEVSAGFGVFVPLGIAVSAEHFSTAHVVVSVTAPVWVILQRGFLGLVHEPPPAFGVLGPRPEIRNVLPTRHCACLDVVTQGPDQDAHVEVDRHSPSGVPQSSDRFACMRSHPFAILQGYANS